MENKNSKQNMENVFFQPWVGSNFPSGGIFGKKIMVLGESHYCKHDCSDCGSENQKPKCASFTQERLYEYLYHYEDCDGWKKTYCKFERALANTYTNHDQSVEIWNSLLFYNYVQIAMSESRVSPTTEQYTAGQKAFFEVLEKYRPEYILCWGKLLWQHMPNLGVRGETIEDVDLGPVPTWEYTLSDGFVVKMIRLRHPSAGFSWDKWHRVIMEFVRG